jgi:hypothetical protein
MVSTSQLRFFRSVRLVRALRGVRMVRLLRRLECLFLVGGDWNIGILWGY